MVVTVAIMAWVIHTMEATITITDGVIPILAVDTIPAKITIHVKTEMWEDLILPKFQAEHRQRASKLYSVRDGQVEVLILTPQ